MGLNYALLVPPDVEPVSLSLAKSQLRIDIPDDDFLIGTYISAAREWCETYCNRAFFPQTWRLSLDSFPFGEMRTTVPMDQRAPYDYAAYWTDLAIRLPKPRLQTVTSFSYLDGNGNPQTLTNPQYTNQAVVENAQYVIDPTSEPARLTPQPSGYWPVPQIYQPGSVQIEYIASSFAWNTVENVSVTQNSGSGPFMGTLAKINCGITSVKDTTGAALSYTLNVVVDNNGSPTGQTQISLTSAPVGNVAVVTYMGGTCPAEVTMAMLLLIGHYYEHREENTDLKLMSVPLGAKSHLKRHRFNVMGNIRRGY